MLTVLVQDFNTFTQEFYNSVIESIQLHLLMCKCGHSGCLSFHAKYERSVITPHGKITLIICRVICSECGHTHALLLSSMVPYSQISSEDQRKIAEAYEIKKRENADPNSKTKSTLRYRNLCPSGSGIDENNVKSVIRRYVKKWRQRLKADSIGLDSLSELTNSCFSHYSKQFMQIRPTPNKLIPSST